MKRPTRFPVTTGNPKYKTAAHKRERRKWAGIMDTYGYLTCAQPKCVMPTRTIPAGQPWHLGHDDTGTSYIGPTHATCNVRDGARRGSARAHAKPRRWIL